eukprot:COSAG05_NODE_4611_length_1439_cov_1.273134_2_plen_246_part_00
MFAFVYRSDCESDAGTLRRLCWNREWQRDWCTVCGAGGATGPAQRDTRAGDGHERGAKHPTHPDSRNAWNLTYWGLAFAYGRCKWRRDTRWYGCYTTTLVATRRSKASEGTFGAPVSSTAISPFCQFWWTPSGGGCEQVATVHSSVTFSRNQLRQLAYIPLGCPMHILGASSIDMRGRMAGMVYLVSSQVLRSNEHAFLCARSPCLPVLFSQRVRRRRLQAESGLYRRALDVRNRFHPCTLGGGL